MEIIIKSKNLPRTLKILGAFMILLSLLFFAEPFSGISFLIYGLALIALSVGIIKKERWTALFGLVYFSLLLLNALINVFFIDQEIGSFVIISIIPFLLLLSFIKILKSQDLEKKISPLPFTILLIAIVFIIVSILSSSFFIFGR
jgi:hypothetical protein